MAILGDSAYPAGAPQDFADCYDPTWGRFKDRTRPALGNHEYLTSGALGYFDYFGAAAGETSQGYYSYDLGVWHIVVLNSLCWEVGGCGRDDPQAQWLSSDLTAHPELCTLAYWHYPRFSSGRNGSTDIVEAYWDLLYQAGAEVVLTGHDHDYERFALHRFRQRGVPSVTKVVNANPGFQEVDKGDGHTRGDHYDSPARPIQLFQESACHGEGHPRARPKVIRGIRSAVTGELWPAMDETGTERGVTRNPIAWMLFLGASAALAGRPKD